MWTQDYRDRMSTCCTARAAVMDMTPAVGPTDIILEEQLPIIYGFFKTQGLPAPVICMHTQTFFMTAPKCERGER